MMVVVVRLGRVQCLLPGRQLGDRVRFDVDHVAMIVTRDETAAPLLIHLDHVVLVVAKDETGLLRGLVLIPGPVILAQAEPSRRGKVGMGRRVAMRLRGFDEFRVPCHRITIVPADRVHRDEVFQRFPFLGDIMYREYLASKCCREGDLGGVLIGI